MELNWLQSILYGMISGISAILPLSSLAHQTLFAKLTGMENTNLMQMSAMIGVLAALLLSSADQIRRILREYRLKKIPVKRRRRSPDTGILAKGRVLATASVSLLPALALYACTNGLQQRLWILAILLGINGIVLFLPPYLPGANKTAQAMSPLDCVLIGFAGSIGAVPGISGVGAAVSAASVRGCDREYTVELSLLLQIPVILFFMANLAFSGIAASPILIAKAALIAATSFVSACCAVVFLRFLAVKAGFSLFAYYSWGAALFTLIIYLI